MHHRKNRTTRREVKRLDRKRSRSAVEQALRGDHMQSPPTWHSYCWKSNELPLDMEPRAPRTTKRTKKIDWCPARASEGNKRHYYIEKTEEVNSFRMRSHRDESGLVYCYEPYTYTHRYKVCMYCRKHGRPSRKGGKHYY